MKESKFWEILQVTIDDLLHHGPASILNGGLKIIVCHLFPDKFMHSNIKENRFNFSLLILIHLWLKDLH